MRRIAVWVSDDILMEEVVAMAKLCGFHVRHVNGLTMLDRVPGIVRKTEPENVVQMQRRGAK
jgi:hypothetical protein